MATTPTIQYLRLDADNDPIWDPNANLKDIDAATQAISTRLNLFLGEWWEDTSIGLPVMQAILGQLGSNQGLGAMTLLVQQNIAGAPYVTSVANTSLSFVDGMLSIVATAMTQFGIATINVTTASSASLET